MMRKPLALALGAALSLTALPAAAADGDCRQIRGAATTTTADDVQVCQQDSWLVEADSKVGNQASTVPTWDTSAPTASVAAGAGGGYLGLAAVAQQTGRHTQQNDATFEGTFTGDIDTIAWTMYLFTSARQADATQAVSLQLQIDGKTVYLTGETADRTPLSAGGNAVQKTEFTFTNVYAAMEKAGVQLGDGVEHTVRLSVSQWFSVNDNAVYVYDTTEAPSSVVFNATKSTGAVIKL